MNGPNVQPEGSTPSEESTLLARGYRIEVNDDHNPMYDVFFKNELIHCAWTWDQAVAIAHRHMSL